LSKSLRCHCFLLISPRRSVRRAVFQVYHTLQGTRTSGCPPALFPVLRTLLHLLRSRRRALHASLDAQPPEHDHDRQRPVQSRENAQPMLDDSVLPYLHPPVEGVRAHVDEEQCHGERRHVEHSENRFHHLRPTSGCTPATGRWGIRAESCPVASAPSLAGRDSCPSRTDS